MPIYDHKCTNEECNYEWEDSYSLKVDPPKICPKCNKDTAQRLITCMSKGKVELYGQDLISKIKGDAQQLKKDMKKSEKIYSNMLGEDKYENLQRQIDKNKR